MWGIVPLLLLLQTPDYNQQGRKALEANNYDAAVQYFTQAVQADPSDFTAHFHLALSYSLLKKDPEGIAEYQKVLALKPGLYEAELNLGILLLRQNRRPRPSPTCNKPPIRSPRSSGRVTFSLTRCWLPAMRPKPRRSTRRRWNWTPDPPLPN